MSTDACLIIEEASTNIPFNAILFIKLLICFGGVAFLLREWNVHGTRFLGHVNSRIIFHSYYSMFVLHGTTIGLQYLADFTRLRFTCVMFDFREVIVLRGLTISSILSAHLILMLMSLERLHSSLFPAHFEKYSARRATAAVAVAVIIGSTFFVIWNISDSFRLFTENFVAMANTKVAQNAERYDKTIFVLSVINGFALLVFFVDIYLNFCRKARKDASLGVSYQLDENRRVILILMPIEIVDSILTLITTLSQLLYSKFVTEASPLSRQIFLESTTFTVAYPLILAIIIEWKVGRRKRVIRPAENVDHFENLQKFWA